MLMLANCTPGLVFDFLFAQNYTRQFYTIHLQKMLSVDEMNDSPQFGIAVKNIMI
jgi:hypothetical protein